MTARRRALVPALLVVQVLLVGCSDPAGPDETEVADGWTVDVVRDDLVGPTQLTTLPDGATVLVAELGGGEDAGRGRVLDLGDEGGAEDAVVLLDQLLTPTGVAAVDPTLLLVQEQRTLSEVVLEGPTPFSVARPPTSTAARVLTADLPFNGRSQGTLGLVAGDGPPIAERPVVLATATGSGSGPDVPAGSGRLYGVAADGTERDVAVGFKNAYAWDVAPDGALLVTEIGDGRYDGEAPPDELHVVPADVWRAALAGTGAPFDGGWPRCTGDGDPTEEFGVTDADCAALAAPLATFPPRSTPTSVAVTDDGRVLVALWVEGRVVEVDRDDGTVTDVVSGLDGPQHLLARPDGSLLLTEHGTGRLLRLVPAA